MNHHPTEILTFWFSHTDGTIASPEKMEFWFGESSETDRLLRSKFEKDLEAARGGELDSWAGTDRGRLALIILLDQFSRNIYRGTPLEVAQDARALELTREGRRLGVDRKLRPLERVFFYLPLEHAEDPRSQEESVAAFRELAGSVSGEARGMYEHFLKYALAHKKIIDRFGHFPYQNKVFGRLTTVEEQEFLDLPGSPFFLSE